MAFFIIRQSKPFDTKCEVHVKISPDLNGPLVRYCMHYKYSQDLVLGESQFCSESLCVTQAILTL